MMRLSADDFLGESSLGAAGASELSWPAPVRAGDILTLQIEVLSMRESNSRPNLGFLELAMELVNQNEEAVIRVVPTMLIAKGRSRISRHSRQLVVLTTQARQLTLGVVPNSVICSIHQSKLGRLVSLGQISGII